MLKEIEEEVRGAMNETYSRELNDELLVSMVRTRANQVVGAWAATNKKSGNEPMERHCPLCISPILKLGSIEMVMHLNDHHHMPYHKISECLEEWGMDMVLVGGRGE